MDYDKLANFLSDPARTTPVFRRRLRQSPNVTLRNSGLHPGDIAALIPALGKVKHGDTHEALEVNFAFQMIDYNFNKKNKADTDDWLIGG